jgi:D-cysteine desulfhydrase
MINDSLQRLRDWPRISLASLPTRLVPAKNLSASLGPQAPEVLVKMDSETGFGLGGNKVRKLEMVLAPECMEGVTHLITSGGPQSNHCRVTAAAAAHLGLKCILVVNGPEAAPPTGNALLHRLFGAEIRTVGRREDRSAAGESVAREIQDSGGRPLLLPLGASTGLGALGYALAALELNAQLEALPGRNRTWVFVSASSCGTIGGLLLGFSLLGRTDVRLVGVSADASAFEVRSDTVRLATEGAALLEWQGELREGSLAAADEFVGQGYGIPTAASDEALELFGRTEGIVLDPVYTAKAAAGMLSWIRSGSVPEGDRVVFVHTGGHPALLV